MSDPVKDGALLAITEHEKKEQTMNDTRDEIRGDLKEVEPEGLVHKGAGQIHGQGSLIDTRVSIRTATPSDGEGLRTMFARASSETIYLRFHMPYPEVPEWMVALMVGAEHHNKMSLVAVAEEKVVGHAMYARLGEGSEAEMAIVVEDGWQSKGVGKSLLLELAKKATLRGIETFTVEVLGHNLRMLGLSAMFAGTDYSMEDGVCHVRMPLRMASAARTLRRAA